MDSSKIFSTFDTWIDRVGNAISWCTVLMVLTTCLVVILRYGFGTGSVFLQETVIYMHSLVIMFGLAYTLKHDGHVRVDLLYNSQTPRNQAWTNLFGHLFLLLPFSLILVRESLGITASIPLERSYVGRSWSVFEGSAEVGGLPGIFLLKSLIPISGGLLAMQAIGETFKTIRYIRNSDWK